MPAARRQELGGEPLSIEVPVDVSVSGELMRSGRVQRPTEIGSDERDLRAAAARRPQPLDGQGREL